MSFAYTSSHEGRALLAVIVVFLEERDTFILEGCVLFVRRCVQPRVEAGRGLQFFQERGSFMEQAGTLRIIHILRLVPF
jgi:hypothetical protein